MNKMLEKMKIWETATDMKMVYMLITPEMAEELLKTNVNNRKVSKGVVMAYANDIKTGNWDEKTGAAISIDSNGNLADGQHRLFGIIDAGVPIKTWVCFGTKPASIYDYNRKRSCSDQLVITRNDLEAVYHSTRFISIATNFIWKYSDAGHTHGRRTVTSKEVATFIDRNKEVLDDFFFKMPQGAVSKISIAPVHLALFLAYLNGVAMDDILAFYAVLKDGMGASQIDFPIIAYRNYLLNYNGSVHTTDIEVGRCQYALKKYLSKSCSRSSRAPQNLIYPYPEKGVLIR